MTPLVAMLLKVSIAMLLALAVAAAATQAAAATRHAIVVAGQIASLLIPAMLFVVPPLTVSWEQPAPLPHATRAPATPLSPHLPTPVPLPPAPRSSAVLAALWIAGASVVAARRIRSFVRAWHVARCAQPWRGVFVSAGVDQPVTFGRRVILPANAMHWNADRLRAVLLHEEAHLARRDTLTGMAGDVTCCLYWFHPLAWLLARRARLEREAACDEAVLAEGVSATEYATVLLSVARAAGRTAHGLPMAARHQLEVRVTRVLDHARRRANGASRVAVLAATLVGAPLLAAVTPLVIARPSSGEPDLLGDFIASPLSERIVVPAVNVEAAGEDAALVALMQNAAAASPRAKDDFVPDRARWALTQVRDGRLVLPLIERLGDGDWRIRAYAAWGVGESRDRRATGALVPLLGDPVWRMRAMAAFALREIGDPAAREAMSAALADPAWQVRLAAVEYLADQHDPAGRGVLEAMLRDRHMAVRAAAEDALQAR